jgi:hypothetical protein
VGFLSESAIAVTVPFGGGIVLLITFVEDFIRTCVLAGRLGLEILVGVLESSCKAGGAPPSSTGIASRMNGAIRGEGGNGIIRGDVG